MDHPEDNSEKVYETECFHMKSFRLTATILLLYGLPTLLFLILFAGLSLIAGFIYDIRWTIVSLMIIFIVTPAILCYMYFYHGLRSSTAVNSIPHIICFSQDAIIVKAMRRKKEESEEEEAQKENPDFEEIYRLCYSYETIDSCRPGRKGYVIVLLKPEKGFLWLPYSAFPKKKDLTFVTDLLKEKLSPKTIDQNAYS